MTIDLTTIIGSSGAFFVTLGGAILWLWNKIESNAITHAKEIQALHEYYQVKLEAKDKTYQDRLDIKDKQFVEVLNKLVQATDEISNKQQIIYDRIVK